MGVIKLNKFENKAPDHTNLYQKQNFYRMKCHALEKQFFRSTIGEKAVFILILYVNGDLQLLFYEKENFPAAFL